MRRWTWKLTITTNREEVDFVGESLADESATGKSILPGILRDVASNNPHLKNGRVTSFEAKRD
ncbi:hypothetical protein ACFU99_23320 [Streptomyces sp. NPDC057654]|uniref:hypothetical protein n=1 Tax=Streptomyces sp. NPDC057654 TaxID=3346196 RepID=UPI0036AE17E6